MANLQFLQKLTECNGIPGFENEVRCLIEAHLPLGVEVSRDKLGSLICKKEGSSKELRIMIPGHMDEIGFMVQFITDCGFVKFIPLGGWWDQVLLAQRVTIKTEKQDILGIIGSKPPHILKEKDRNTVVAKEDMFIDIGARDKAHALEMGVRPGDPIFPVSPFSVLANPDMVLAKALDDRLGCAAFVEVLERLTGESHPNTVFGVGTVQEEVGLRGAKTSAFAISPTVCIAIDVGIAGDMPGIEKQESSLKLGDGPVLYLADRSAIAHVGLRRWVTQLAEAHQIPLQVTTLLGGGTDSGSVHLNGSGVPSLTLGVPVRYVHSHGGIMHLKDYDRLVELLVLIVKNLDEETLERLI